MAHLADHAGHLVLPRRVAERILVTLCLVASGCGGKLVTDSEDEAGAVGGSGGASGTMEPARMPTTCEAICTHVVGACAPGASTAACVPPCEKTRASAACPAERDAYLACLVTVPVTCKGSEVVIVGCSDERRAFEHCTL